MNILGFFLAASAVCASIYVFAFPAKLMLRLIVNSAAGFCVLVLLNTLFVSFGVPGVSVNLVTCLITGALGLPGLALVYILTVLL